MIKTRFDSIKSIAFLAFIVFFTACNSSDDSPEPVDDSPVQQEVIPPSLQTNDATNIERTGARLGGNLLDEGSGEVNRRGVAWSFNTNPTINDSSRFADGSGLGNFFVDLPNAFQSNTTYNFRAFAEVNGEYYYGENKSFTTLSQLPPPPQIEILTIRNITTSKMKITGVVNETSGSITDKGFVLAEDPNPTLNDIVADDGDSGTGQYTVEVEGLDPRTVYYVRPFVRITGQVIYGEDMTARTVGYRGEAGGYVVYDKGEVTDNWQYMEASPSGMNKSRWGCDGLFISGLSQDLGTGPSNTTRIVSNCSESGIAAKVCNGFTFGGKSDWFLGSVEDMSIAVVSMAQNNTLLDYNAIWTSSQLNGNTAYWVSPDSSGDGPFVEIEGKGFSLLVLPIRIY